MLTLGWFAIVVFLVFAAVSCSDGVAVDQGVLNEPVDDAVVVDQAVSSEPVDLPSHGGPLRVNHGASYVYGGLFWSNGCVRIRYVDANNRDRITEGLLLIWPSGFGVVVNDGVTQVVDDQGAVVASAGEMARISGRFAWSEPDQGAGWEWDGELSELCAGPYWVVGDEVSVGASLSGGESDSSIYFPRMVHQRGEVVMLQASLEGRLVLRDNCLRVVPPDWLGPEDYLIIWPPGFAVESDGEDVVVVNGGGNRMVLVGEPVRLGGGFSSSNRADATCPGEYFNAYTVGPVR